MYLKNSKISFKKTKKLLRLEIEVNFTTTSQKGSNRVHGNFHVPSNSNIKTRLTESVQGNFHVHGNSDIKIGAP